ncbi:MAG: PAS domain-containing protein [Planctomycetota bacterium]
MHDPSDLLTREILHRLVAFAGVCFPDGTLVEANEPALAVGGFTRDDVLGQKFWDCPWWSHDPAEQARLRDAVDQVAAGHTVRYDAVVRMAGDEFITIDFMLAPLTGDAGRVTHLIPSATDITDRVAAQRQAVRQFGLIQSIYDTTPVALWTFDRDLRFERANPALWTWSA